MAGKGGEGCGGTSRRRAERTRRHSREDCKAGWIKQDCENLQSYDELEQRDDYEPHFRNKTGEEPPEVVRPLCTRDIPAALASGRPSTSKGPCPRKDVLAKLAPTTDIAGIRAVIEQVANGEITTTAELIFCLTPHVGDRGALLRYILERELSFFRDIVNDTVDRRTQDEADVMMHTQNDIQNKFSSLTDAMAQRTTRIRQRLNEISPNFNWAQDGRDRTKISKLIIAPLFGDPKKHKQKDDNTLNVVDKLMHQVFMRGQWLKKELTRLQNENENLEFFLDKFRTLASERKQQESHVPRMLLREREQLERELSELRKTYKRNLEVIDALYVEHHRCIKPQSESLIVD